MVLVMGRNLRFSGMSSSLVVMGRELARVGMCGLLGRQMEFKFPDGGF